MLLTSCWRFRAGTGVVPGHAVEDVGGAFEVDPWGDAVEGGAFGGDAFAVLPQGGVGDFGGDFRLAGLGQRLGLDGVLLEENAAVLHDDALFGQIHAEAELGIGDEETFAGTNDGGVEAVRAHDHVRRGFELLGDAGEGVAVLDEVGGFAEKIVAGEEELGVDFAEKFTGGIGVGGVRISAKLIGEKFLGVRSFAFVAKLAGLVDVLHQRGMNKTVAAWRCRPWRRGQSERRAAESAGHTCSNRPRSRRPKRERRGKSPDSISYRRAPGVVAEFWTTTCGEAREFLER